MSRLSKLYQTMENLKELGLSINEDLIQEANELEEEIIKKEILPVLSKTIEPALQPVKRELVLVVDYVPEQPLSVHLSRKRNFAAELTDAKEMVLDPEQNMGKWDLYLKQLSEEGQFADLAAYEKKIHDNNWLSSVSFQDQQDIGFYLADTFRRLWVIANHYRQTNVNDIPERFWKSILRY